MSGAQSELQSFHRIARKLWLQRAPHVKDTLHNWSGGEDDDPASNV
jgi:hypothetical protein